MRRPERALRRPLAAHESDGLTHVRERPGYLPRHSVDRRGPAGGVLHRRPGGVDRYSFVVPAAGSYTIETQGPTDVLMSLYGPNNLASLVTEDDDSGAGSNARIVSNLTAGTYFVQVRHFNAGSTGNYSISVRSGTIFVAQIQVNGPAVRG